MLQETNQLELLFKDEMGKSKKITLRKPRLDVSAIEAEATVNALVNADIFANEHGDPYASGVGARYVKRVVEDIYSAE